MKIFNARLYNCIKGVDKWIAFWYNEVITAQRMRFNEKNIKATFDCCSPRSCVSILNETAPCRSKGGDFLEAEIVFGERGQACSFRMESLWKNISACVSSANQARSISFVCWSPIFFTASMAASFWDMRAVVVWARTPSVVS